MPAFSSEKAVAIVERELGAPVSVLFREFDVQPIAAASLGQVHTRSLTSPAAAGSPLASRPAILQWRCIALLQGCPLDAFCVLPLMACRCTVPRSTAASWWW